MLRLFKDSCMGRAEVFLLSVDMNIKFLRGLIYWVCVVYTHAVKPLAGFCNNTLLVKTTATKLPDTKKLKLVDCFSPQTKKVL